MKWSNRAFTRSPEGLTPRDTAEGYIPMALRVMEGKAKLGETPEERRETLRKAERVLRAAGITPRLGVSGFATLRRGAGS